MTDEYDTDRRVALDPALLTGPYVVHYAPTMTSTQARAKELLDGGEQAPVVVVTDEQTAGRGRLDRTWSAPARSSILMSIGLAASLHHPAFTLGVGVVVAEALVRSGLPVRLKWPNDVVILDDGRMRKLGGILAELHGSHVVVGIGLNIDIDDAELPTADAISCRQLGRPPVRESLIDEIAADVSTLSPAASIARYRELCLTLGAEVRVSRIVGEPLEGRAADVDDDGGLHVADASGAVHRVTVGDVEHLFPMGPR